MKAGLKLSEKTLRNFLLFERREKTKREHIFCLVSMVIQQLVHSSMKAKLLLLFYASQRREIVRGFESLSVGLRNVNKEKNSLSAHFTCIWFLLQSRNGYLEHCETFCCGFVKSRNVYNSMDENELPSLDSEILLGIII